MSLADNLIMRFLETPMTACLMVDVGVPKARFFFAFFFFLVKTNGKLSCTITVIHFHIHTC